MQPNTPKDQRNEPNQRQRPLQKSMFLPDQYPTQQGLPNRNQPIEFAPFNPMKRSSTAVMETVQPNITPIGGTSFHHNYSFNQSNFGNNPSFHSNEQRGQGQQEMLFHNNSLNTIKTSQQLSMQKHQTSEITENKIRVFSRNEKGNQMRLSETAIQAPNSLSANQTQSLIQEIVSQIRDKHLPQTISKATTEIYDYIYNLRMELQVLRQQFKAFTKKQEGVNSDIQGKIKSINSNSTINFNSTNVNNISTRSKKEGKEADLADLQTNFFLLENKIGQIGQNAAKMHLEFQKMQNRLDSELRDKVDSRLKISSIKSSLPSIMLEYRQLFFVKKLESLNFKSSFEEEQIQISASTYYIDRQGYLLDNESRYITDQKGAQIRLDQKHLKLLESHRVLQK